MVMLYLQDRHVFLNSKEISQRLNISPTYLKKIMRKLVVNDLVKANTGIGGGYKYKSNKKVTLYDIYVALNDEVEIFALKTDYVSKIFEGALAVDKRYNKYLKKVNTVNKAIKSSLEDITIESLVEDILEENAKIRLDWNNWEDEFERVNVFFKG
jgi:transcriptional regulator, badM/rrf2 family